ncbi:TIGR03943 family protein [Lachnospiraceae bacterium NK3A20]|nr:TIGR03943 family protein [Lachnospiraceae bacterium NK3A20]
MADKIPVYVINGFLESGKSSFFAYTLGQPYFQTKGRTLLILCEEGEVEFSKPLLDQTRTDKVVIENAEEFTPAALMALNAKYQPERILIEWNGMWNFKEFRLPHAMMLEQQITCIDASTFGMYYQNLGMRSLLFEELKNSELVMFNRCDDIDEETLVKYKRNVQAICQQAELIFEDANGEIDMTTEEDLPFDINQDVIDLQGLNYGIWYLDAMEHPDRYAGKKIRYQGLVAVPDGFPKGYFVPGRMAMTCCAQDMQFLGYACQYDNSSDLKEKDWVTVTADVEKEAFDPYGGEGIVLHAVSVEPAAQPEDPVINFAG